jgi:hypothetical protein
MRPLRFLLTFGLMLNLFAPLNAERVYVPQYKKPLDRELMTGAEIDEAAVTQVLYVDSGHPSASDDNPGTDPELPLLTIEHGIDAALELMEATDDGVKLFIANGTYTTPEFEWAPLADRYRRGLTVRQKSNTLIVEGESRGGVFIDGTAAVPTEEIINYGDGLYGFPWTKNYGLSRDIIPANGEWGTAIGHRIESVFVNRQQLEIVMLEPHYLDMSTFQKWIPIEESFVGREGVTKPGTFGVSEITDDMIYFRPPEGMDMEGAEVRVGIGGPFLQFAEKSNVVVRNLVIFGTILPYSQIHRVISFLGTEDIHAENFLIEDVEIYGTSAGYGLGISLCDNVTLRRFIARRNGCNGFAGTRNKNWVVEDVDFSENNWRTWAAGVRSDIAGGWKILQSVDMSFERFIAYDNHANGLWFDSDQENTYINELYAVANNTAGFYNEKNFGEFLVENSVMMTSGNYGIYMAQSGNTTIRDCISFNNEKAQLGIRVRDNFNSDPSVTNQKLPQDIYLEGNLFVVGGLDGLQIYNYDGADRSYYLDTFIATFAGADNQYWSPFLLKPFVAESALDFSGWLARVPEGEEAGSVFADPGIHLLNDGIADFYMFENPEAASLDALANDDRFNEFAWDYGNKRPVLDMPLNWREHAAVEVHFVLNAPQSGSYTFVLNTNLEADLFMGLDASVGSLSTDPLIQAGTAINFRDWSDSGNGVAEIDLAAGGLYRVVIRAIAHNESEMPFLSVGWHAPWMESGDIKPLAGPYIRSAEDVPERSRSFLATGSRMLNNSYKLDGFGTYWLLENDYLYHSVHRTLYVPETQAVPEFWGYMGSFGWTYFNLGLGESWLYSSALGSWVYALGSWEGTAWYYVFSGEQQGYVTNP